MSQMEMSSNLNMVTSTNTSIQGHQMMQQQMQSPLMSHSPMGSMQNKPIVQQMNRQQPQQQNQMQIGQPPVMMPHQQSQQMQMNQMQQRSTQQQPQSQQLQQQQSQQQQMGYPNYYANFGNR